jgi:hypothetical protein
VEAKGAKHRLVLELTDARGKGRRALPTPAELLLPAH